MMHGTRYWNLFYVSIRDSLVEWLVQISCKQELSCVRREADNRKAVIDVEKHNSFARNYVPEKTTD